MIHIQLVSCRVWCSLWWWARGAWGRLTLHYVLSSRPVCLWFPTHRIPFHKQKKPSCLSKVKVVIFRWGNLILFFRRWRESKESGCFKFKNLKLSFVGNLDLVLKVLNQLQFREKLKVPSTMQAIHWTLPLLPLNTYIVSMCSESNSSFTHLNSGKSFLEEKF